MGKEKGIYGAPWTKETFYAAKEEVKKTGIKGSDSKSKGICIVKKRKNSRDQEKDN